VYLLVMLFVGSQNSGFESTFRVVSYVSVTNLVNWIPFIGGLLALYGLYLAVVGIRARPPRTAGGRRRDARCDLRRIPLLRTWVNKDKRRSAVCRPSGAPPAASPLLPLAPP
jgi:hypothetical protein